jgi:hypothetical protein
MNADALFSLLNTLALGSWLIIIFFPRWHSADKLIVGVVITLLCIIYLVLLLKSFHFSDVRQFNSLKGVGNLFSNPWMLLAGWVHYLAFDLLTGLFIVKNAAKLGIRHLAVIPSLVLTFMLGPVGLLAYLVTRYIVTKNYFEDNF